MNFTFEERLDDQSKTEIEQFIRQHEEILHTAFSGGLFERFTSIINTYQRYAAEATATRKQMIEDTVTYLQSFKMISEMVGLAETHAEKSARLRGMIELLDRSISKLKEEQSEDILNNWPHFRWGSFSDYPYQSILEKFDVLRKENEDLKKKLITPETRNA